MKHSIVLGEMVTSWTLYKVHFCSILFISFGRENSGNRPFFSYYHIGVNLLTEILTHIIAVLAQRSFRENTILIDYLPSFLWVLAHFHSDAFPWTEKIAGIKCHSSFHLFQLLWCTLYLLDRKLRHYIVGCIRVRKIYWH